MLERLTRENFAEVWRIMEKSFPIDERRTRENQERLLNNPFYQLYGYKKDGALVAFLAVWKFDGFLFVEHFAVDESQRNGGIGGKILTELLEMLKLPTVLEVELPESSLTQRRIGFYERNGFVLNPYDYMQPALSKQGKAIPLLIMSYPQAIDEMQFERVKKTLYREVYGIR